MRVAASEESDERAEGVGFEPTVGFPTLDFESSALNRTQPPFLNGRRKLRTPNVEHPTSDASDADTRVCGGFSGAAVSLAALALAKAAVRRLGRGGNLENLPC